MWILNTVSKHHWNSAPRQKPKNKEKIGEKKEVVNEEQVSQGERARGVRRRAGRGRRLGWREWRKEGINCREHRRSKKKKKTGTSLEWREEQFQLSSANTSHQVCTKVTLFDLNGRATPALFDPLIVHVSQSLRDVTQVEDSGTVAFFTALMPSLLLSTSF